MHARRVCYRLWIQNVYSIRTKFAWLAPIQPLEHLKAPPAITAAVAAASPSPTSIDKQTKWLLLKICCSTSYWVAVICPFTLPHFHFLSIPTWNVCVDIRASGTYVKCTLALNEFVCEYWKAFTLWKHLHFMLRFNV